MFDGGDGRVQSTRTARVDENRDRLTRQCIGGKHRNSIGSERPVPLEAGTHVRVLFLNLIELLLEVFDKCRRLALHRASLGNDAPQHESDRERKEHRHE